MNKSIIKNKQKAITAIREYRKSLFEEFLLKAKELKKEMYKLWETGVNEELFICLDDTETEHDFCYIKLSKRMVLDLTNILNKMDNESGNEMQLFKNFTDTHECSDFYYYQEFEEMEKILYADMSAKEAEDFINM